MAGAALDTAAHRSTERWQDLDRVLTREGPFSCFEDGTPAADVRAQAQPKPKPRAHSQFVRARRVPLLLAHAACHLQLRTKLHDTRILVIGAGGTSRLSQIAAALMSAQPRSLVAILFTLATPQAWGASFSKIWRSADSPTFM